VDVEEDDEGPSKKMRTECWCHTITPYILSRSLRYPLQILAPVQGIPCWCTSKTLFQYTIWPTRFDYSSWHVVRRRYRGTSYDPHKSRSFSSSRFSNKSEPHIFEGNTVCSNG
jgi:hypothetical protein